ncbi:MAG: hypothetical protein LKI27_01145 [Actinomyces sp.]|jgi:signal transduction histidine kinase|nr:hypothetical protein [Actinomyces sp.]MCI1642066.1 hypothetical protein [Actinomyces sp.]MCI1661492.1 hypothetical protein [Actinomyces sp.]
MRWISRSPGTPARGRAGRRCGRRFGRRIVFSSFGAILLALELLVNNTEGLTAPNAWFSAAACLCLALVGWMPTLGGLLYTAVMVAGAGMPGELVPLALPSLGIYAVCGEWVSRRRYVPAALALLAVEGARLATSPSPEAEAAGMVLACSVAVPIGLGVQRSERRTSDLERRAALAERHASEARAAVHRGLARELHDTAVRDLARIVIASQSIAQRSADPGVVQEAERLTELAAHAMRSIRSLMTGGEQAAAEEAPPPPPRGISPRSWRSPARCCPVAASGWIATFPPASTPSSPTGRAPSWGSPSRRARPTSCGTPASRRPRAFSSSACPGATPA